MQIDYSRKFDKQLKKVPLEIKMAFRTKLEKFLSNPMDSTLNNHSLLGKFLGYRSINVTGDWRVIYSESINDEGESVAIFELLGTHSQLYK